MISFCTIDQNVKQEILAFPNAENRELTGWLISVLMPVKLAGKTQYGTVPEFLMTF
ncbi:MAG: hypothetical protein ACI8ZB_003103 [Desulforhopalus sp.]|jgi:hypothetical protein